MNDQPKHQLKRQGATVDDDVDIPPDQTTLPKRRRRNIHNTETVTTTRRFVEIKRPTIIETIVSELGHCTQNRLDKLKEQLKVWESNGTLPSSRTFSLIPPPPPPPYFNPMYLSLIFLCTASFGLSSLTQQVSSIQAMNFRQSPILNYTFFLQTPTPEGIWTRNYRERSSSVMPYMRLLSFKC